jgi:hypothetical protein
MLSYAFSNGIILDSKRIYNQTIKGTSTNNCLCFGTIASTYMELVLDNTDGFFDSFSFKNVYVNVYDDDVIRMKLYIDSVKEKSKMLTIKAYDKLTSLDKTWRPCKTPITLYNFIDNICVQTGITLNCFYLVNGGFKIQNVDALKGKTCRECLKYALEICGTYAYLDSYERLNLKWFNFSNPTNIDISKLKNYSTDYENSTVDNIYFVRGDKVYSTNSKPKGSIFITKDNPLLKDASSKKVQSIINKLDKKIGFTYLPCQINAADFFTYDIGETVSFTDYKGNNRNAIIGTVVYKGYNSVDITSVSVDEQDISTNETSESVDTDATASGEISFYKKMYENQIEYKECGDTTEIEYIVDFEIEDAFDDVEVIVNDVHYKSYCVHNGNNTIACMIKGDLINDTLTTIKLSTENTLENVELNTFFRNCLVIDYSEDDDDFEVGEEVLTLASNERFTKLKTINIDCGIQGWNHYEEENMTNKNGDTGKYECLRLYNGVAGVELPNADTNYMPELTLTKYKGFYDDLMNNKHYIRLTFNGSYTYKSRWGDSSVLNGKTFIFDNDSNVDGTLGRFCYKKCKKGELIDNAPIYISKNGIIEIEDDDIIAIGIVVRYADEPTNIWTDENLKVSINLIDDYLTLSMNTHHVALGVRECLFNGETIKMAFKQANAADSIYTDNNFVGKFVDGTYIDVNNQNQYELDISTTEYCFIFRNYATKGYEKFTPEESE